MLVVRNKRNRHLLFRLFCLLGACLSACSLPADRQVSAHELQVSANGRYLEQTDGTPFYYLGDTAWELFHRLNREEAAIYLENRAKRGFTVIQAVVLAELDGLHTPNPYGDLPLVGDDPMHPNEAYFTHVDTIVNQAEALGLFIGMLPTWGDKFNKKWGVGPEIFTPENAEAYGAFLGARYRDKPIIWILGGDRNPENDEDLEIIRRMAAGLEKGDGGTHLMTYHPQGGSNSSQWFHADAWLDFNMFQSGHGQQHMPNYDQNWKNYTLEPVKPTLDGEPRYEDHPINWKPELGWFDEWDVRQAAYWGALSGSCGHTYGDHNIWQMWQPGRKAISSARTPWQQAIDHPGAAQMGYLRQLLTQRPWYRLVPDDDLLLNDTATGAGRIIGALAVDTSFALIYTPLGAPMEIDTTRWQGRKLKAQWFDPRTGKTSLAEVENGLYRPPVSPTARDWVLVLERN